MSHLEDILFEWYDWRGYLVKRNVAVGRLSHGGWEGELDIVAYHPTTRELVHLEPSIDASSWAKREQRFTKKFRCGRKYILTDVFPWLDRRTPLRQIAVLTSRGQRTKLAGGDLVTMDEIASKIREDIQNKGKMVANAIPEKYPLLRTVQLFTNGYKRDPSVSGS